jgi:deoxyribose-phosphate aldolase
MPDQPKRSVVTATDIDGSQPTISVSADAIVTPAAQDRAHDLGVTIVRQSAVQDSTETTRAASGAAESDLIRRIEHTNLSLTATGDDIARLCEEASAWGCAAVCISATYVSLAARLCKSGEARVCGVAGFPTGAHHTKIKIAEAIRLVRDGAVEVDMVANHALLLADELSAYAADIRAVRETLGDQIILKVIIEASSLSDEEIVRAAIAAESAGANYVKTSTGVYGHARVQDVALLRTVLQPSTKIKAAGGIKDAEFAMQLVSAGADRLGMSQTVNVL